MTYLAGLGFSLSLIIAIGAQNVFVLRQGLRREHVLMVVAVCAVSDALLIAVGVSGVGAAVVGVPWLVAVARWGGATFLLGYALVAARRAWRPGAGLDVGSGGAESQEFEQDGADGASGPGGLGLGEMGLGGRGQDDAMAASIAAAPVVTAPVASAPVVPGFPVVPGSPIAPGATPRVAEVRRSGTTARATLLAVLAVTWLNPHVYLDTVLFMGTVASTYGDLRWIFAAGAATGSVVWFLTLGYGARLLSGPLSRPGAWRVLDGIIAAVMACLAVMLAAGA
ncbi:LysE/ArgO family amino acid transporter [Demequina salsinemoris]|uniref:LysE/ArgO family amino acid transporter n=1 Tax=Demequina salsinemoris TaxID=577470 RepID=UPI000A021C00|nr:LysE/ArgO family amino acid transporter [Demequina salsinemoris]